MRAEMKGLIFAILLPMYVCADTNLISKKNFNEESFDEDDLQQKIQSRLKDVQYMKSELQLKKTATDTDPGVMFKVGRLFISIKSQLYKMYVKFQTAVENRLSVQEELSKLQQDKLLRVEKTLESLNQNLHDTEERVLSKVANATQIGSIQDELSEKVKNEIVQLKKDVEKEKEELVSKVVGHSSSSVKLLEDQISKVKEEVSKENLDKRFEAMLSNVISATQEMVKKEVARSLAGVLNKKSLPEVSPSVKADNGKGGISELIQKEVRRQMYVPRPAKRQYSVRRDYVDEEDLD